MKKEERDAWTKRYEGIETGTPIKPQNKFHAVKTGMLGKVLDSGREAGRYLDLSLLQAAKQISNLKRQVPFAVMITPRHGGIPIFICQWFADFTYTDERGNEIYEDAKGVKTKDYILKKKLVEAYYAIKITEV